MKTIGFQVLVFGEGASAPETVANANTMDQAERLRDHYVKQADERGWRKRVEIRTRRL